MRNRHHEEEEEEDDEKVVVVRLPVVTLREAAKGREEKEEAESITRKVCVYRYDFRKKRGK